MTGLVCFVVLILLMPLLGAIGSVELAIIVLVAVLVGVLVARRSRAGGPGSS